MEPWYNGITENMFAITRFRYIEVLSSLLLRGKENRSLYRGLRYTVEPLFRGNPRDQG